METQIVEGIAQIKKTGTACIGCMAWESPYIVFEIDGAEYRWHSDTIPEIVSKLEANLTLDYLTLGTWVDIQMRVRGNKVWRVLHLSYR